MSTYLLMRLDFASGRSLGPSRVAILEGVDRLGSISAAARAVGMTYRQVWSTIKLLNEVFPAPLVETRVGGPSSGASLTPLGKQLVELFRTMERNAITVLAPDMAAFERLLGEDPEAPVPTPRWARAETLPRAATPKRRGPAKRSSP